MENGKRAISLEDYMRIEGGLAFVGSYGRMQKKARVAPIDHPGFNKRTLREH